MSCKQTVSDLQQVVDVQGGRCRLINSSGNNFFCLNFASGSDSNADSDICTTKYNQYRTSHSISGIDWLSGNANTCDTGSTVGRCTISAGTVYYYSASWTAGNAQTDCTSTQSGTWTP